MQLRKNLEWNFYTLLVWLLAAFMGFPLLWALLTSLKTEAEMLGNPLQFFPSSLNFRAYTRLFEQTDFWTWFGNSIQVSIPVVILTLLICTPGAYAMGRYRTRLVTIISQLGLYSYMVPSILLIVPIYQILGGLQLVNTLPGLVLVYTALNVPFGLWVQRSYFAGSPISIEEAALIDGATRWQAFYKVVLPQAVPGLIATSIFVFNRSWIEYLFASILLRRSEKMTLSAGISSLMGETGVWSWTSLMAATVTIIVPVLVIFIILQSQLIEGASAGATKG